MSQEEYRNEARRPASRGGRRAAPSHPEGERRAAPRRRRKKGLGAWGVLYAVTPEIYPTRLRGAASGAAAAVGRVAAIVAPLLVPWFLTLSGGNKTVAFVIFAVAFVLGCIAALCLPERKGLDLED